MPTTLPLTADQVALHTQGEVVGDGQTVFNRVAPAAAAGPGDLTFADSDTFFDMARNRGASGILCTPEHAAVPGCTLIRVRCPRTAFATLLHFIAPDEAFEPGIHPSAVVHPSAQVDPSAHIGPLCHLAAESVVGPRSVLLGGNHLGRGARLGAEVRLFPNAVVYAGCILGDRVRVHAGSVIGSDGYGYVFDQGRHLKVPQIGTVEVGADVEIGANAAIDRGAIGATVIGAGTKIDNLVHVAHNVIMGRHCLVLGQVGFAGSTKLGNYCVVASQSGIAGHLTLGDQARVGAKSGVMRDVPPGTTVLGIPAQPDRQTKRQWVGLQQLPDLLRRLRDLEARVASLDPKPGA